MADVGNPNDPQTPPESKGPTPDEQKAARRALLEKFEVESARNAPPQQQQQSDDDDESIDLTGLDPQVAAAIKRKLKRANDKDKHVATLAEFGIEQAQRAKALELGREFQLDDAEVASVQKALKNSRTPDAVDLAGRELAIKFREDGTVVVAKPAANTGTPDGGTPPPVDQGKGSGANRAAALLEKIDAIDPYDPKGAEKLAEYEKEMQAAQTRFMQRGSAR